MRGDQLARQWRSIRAIEASPNGLTVTEIAQRDETGIRMICGTLGTLQAAGFPSPCHVKAQRAPKEIFRLLLSFLVIFLTPTDSIRKTITGFPARPPLRLCVRKIEFWAGFFGKNKSTHKFTREKGPVKPEPRGKE